jgi:hypothetical protein
MLNDYSHHLVYLFRLPGCRESIGLSSRKASSWSSGQKGGDFLIPALSPFSVFTLSAFARRTLCGASSLESIRLARQCSSFRRRLTTHSTSTFFILASSKACALQPRDKKSPLSSRHRNKTGRIKKTLSMSQITNTGVTYG